VACVATPRDAAARMAREDLRLSDTADGLRTLFSNSLMLGSDPMRHKGRSRDRRAASCRALVPTPGTDPNPPGCTHQPLGKLVDQVNWFSGDKGVYLVIDVGKLHIEFILSDIADMGCRRYTGMVDKGVVGVR